MQDVEDIYWNVWNVVIDFKHNTEVLGVFSVYAFGSFFGPSVP